MPSKSKKQARFMAAVAHSRKFAKKAGVPQSVGKEFNRADKRKRKAKDSTMGKFAADEIKHDPHSGEFTSGGGINHEKDARPGGGAHQKVVVSSMRGHASSYMFSAKTHSDAASKHAETAPKVAAAHSKAASAHAEAATAYHAAAEHTASGKGGAYLHNGQRVGETGLRADMASRQANAAETRHNKR